MPDPVFEQETGDDYSWSYPASLNDLTAALTNPTKWFVDNIKGKGPNGSCNDLSAKICIATDDAASSRYLEFWGICSATVYHANGYGAFFASEYAKHFNEFVATLEDREPFLIQEFESSWQARVEGMDAMIQAARESRARPNVSLLWDTMDALLRRLGPANPEIVVSLRSNNQVGSVHVELGSSFSFTTAFYTAIGADIYSYLNWIAATSSFNPVPRKLRYRDSAGTLQSVPLNSSSVFTARGIFPQFVPFDGCSDEEPDLTACNIDIGDVQSFNAAASYVNLNLESVVVKPYCRAAMSARPCGE